MRKIRNCLLLLFILLLTIVTLSNVTLKTGRSTPRVNYTANSSSSLPITGRVAYESSNTKLFKIAPYLLILIIALAIVGLLLSKRHKNI